jgi:dolichol-phosphate mannosyltransferase
MNVSRPDAGPPPAWADARVVAVVPTYNEAANIDRLLTRLNLLPIDNLRIVVVDDGSPDGTADIADKIGRRLLAERQRETVTVLRRSIKDGLGKAYVAGMNLALSLGADYVVQMDADLSHSPEYIPSMLDTIVEQDAGAVIGSRYVPGGSLADEWKLHRRLLSGWANLYVNVILGMGVRDATAGFKVWNAEVLRTILDGDLTSAGYSFQVEMNYRCQRAGHRMVEFPIHFEERHGGSSKMTLRVKLESAVVPFALRWRGRKRR